MKNGALVIAGKDLRNLFFSPLFWIIAAICSFVWSFTFFIAVRDFANRTLTQAAETQGQGGGLNLHIELVSTHFAWVHVFMIFAVSALTMRLFTEEKRQRTYDLLLTAPVTATDIALGKLIAGVLTAWALLALSALYPMSLAFFGSVDWGPLFAGYLGLMLLIAGYVAIGIFASSLTDSPVVSVILSLVFSFMLWLLGAAGDSSDSTVPSRLLEQMNVSAHITKYMRGSISIAGFVFFAGIVAFFTFLTQRIVESSRWR